MTHANTPAPLARPSNLDDTMRLAETFCRSGFFSDAREAAQAVVKIIAGQELGFGPMASMTGVHVIKGKVALSSNLLGAAIKRSGRYDYRVIVLTDDRAELAFFENGQQVGASAFTMDDAKRAGLLSNQTWKSYPRNMLLARALSNGARWYCPDVFGGAIYTPDELGAAVDGETGDVIEATPRPPSSVIPHAEVADAGLLTDSGVDIGGKDLDDFDEDATATEADDAGGWTGRVKAATGHVKALAELWRDVQAEPNRWRRSYAQAAIVTAFAPAITAQAADGLTDAQQRWALGVLAEMGTVCSDSGHPDKCRAKLDDAAALASRAHDEVAAVAVAS